MWASWVVAAIALGAAAFMLKFLMALLRESAPSVYNWIVPLRRKAHREIHGPMGVIHVKHDCRVPEYNRSGYYAKLLENENYAMEECSSGLIALDIRPVSDGLVWRSIHPRSGYVFREHRFGCTNRTTGNAG